MRYAKFCDCGAGTKLRADDGFTCIRAGSILEVKLDPDFPAPYNLYVDCSDGRHFIDGQIDNDSQQMIGFTKEGA